MWVPTHRGCGGGWNPRGTPEGFLFVLSKRNPSDSKEKNAFWVGQFGDTGNSGHHTVWDFQVAIPKIYARLGCNKFSSENTGAPCGQTLHPGKRTGAKRRRAKKTAPQSRKVHGIPTYLCRTAKINPFPGILNHPKRLSFRGLGRFLWPRPKKAPQGFRNPPPGCTPPGAWSPPHPPGGVAAPASPYLFDAAGLPVVVFD